MIDKCANFEEVRERKSGRGNDRNRAGLWDDHPLRKMEVPAVRLPDQKMTNAVVLILTDYDNGLSSQRVKWISNNNIESRIPGIMTLLP
ncbi:hypothetical protein NKJ94_37085, partial [Mesorhizobium sp. M0060]